MAFSLFAIFAILLKYKQNFSKASYTMFTQKNNLSNNIIKNKEVLRSWVSANIVVFSTLPINIIRDKLKLDDI